MHAMKGLPKFLLLVLAALSTGLHALAKELPPAKPEDVGMSSTKVDEVMLDYVAKKKLAGAILTELEGDAPTGGHDCSTNGLIDFYKALNGGAR